MAVINPRYVSVLLALVVAAPLTGWAPEIAAGDLALQPSLEIDMAIFTGNTLAATNSFLALLDGAKPSSTTERFALARAALNYSLERFPATDSRVYQTERQLANVELAERLIDLRAAEDTPPWRHAGAVVQTATMWQAAALGLEPSLPLPLRGLEDPIPALEALAQRHDAEIERDDLADAFSSTPFGLQRAVARLVDAFLAMEMAGEIAYETVDLAHLARIKAAAMEGIPVRNGSGFDTDLDTTLDGLQMAQHRPETIVDAGVDVPLLLATRAQFVDALMALREEMDRAGGFGWAPCETIAVAPAFSIDLSNCDNIYTEDFALLLDAGGSDVYFNNAGGNNLQGGRCNEFPIAGVTAALIDFGDENDRFGDSVSHFRRCGMTGGGYFGQGFLWVEGGDNLYDAGMDAVNGGGIAGLGFLLDGGGNDTYRAIWAGTNGGSITGLGMLVDLSGSDSYTSVGTGANGGARGTGVGLLIDFEGDDTFEGGTYATNGGGVSGGIGALITLGGENAYTALGPGINGGGAGAYGVGFLFNAEGASTYWVHGDGTNGGGFFRGYGMLLDFGGGSSFTAAGTGSNGGAAIYASGLLISGPGSDSFSGEVWGANGGAVFAGSGFLLNLGGDNRYVAEDWGTNGGGRVGGFGTLIDLEGNDAYIATSEGVNGGASDGFGLLLDLAGNDWYEEDGAACWDCSVVPKGFIAGAQLDLP